MRGGRRPCLHGRFSGKGYYRSSKTSRCEDWEVEEPVACGNCSSFHFHATLAGMLGPTLIGYQVVEVCQPCETRLLAPLGMMEALHREQLPLDGMMGLIQQGAGDGHLWVCEHRLPPGCLLLEPAPDALAMDRPRRVGDVVGTVTSPLAERKHAQAFALSRPV
jgi:hypothetical protein